MDQRQCTRHGNTCQLDRGSGLRSLSQRFKIERKPPNISSVPSINTAVIGMNESKPCAMPCTAQKSAPTRRVFSSWGGRDRVQVETGFGLDREHLARRLHYSGALPTKNHRGVRPRSAAGQFAARSVLQGASSRESDALAFCRGARGPGGIAAPAFMSALAYYDGYRSAQLPANLLQAQRDYFGAHTYERIDQPRGVSFHLDWSKPDRPQIKIADSR